MTPARPRRSDEDARVTDHLLPDARVVAAYVALRRRVIDLLRDRDESDGERNVPHCPAWTVRDLLAHMVGVPEDILAGRMEGVTTEAWTAAQVDRHRGESLAELLDSWESLSTQFDSVLPMIPAPINSQMVLDAVTHEHDLRHALGVPGARDVDGVAVAVGWLLYTADGASPGVAGQLRSLDLDDFDLLRVGTGRRSRAQIAGVGLDVDTVERLLDGSPLSPPTTSLFE